MTTDQGNDTILWADLSGETKNVLEWLDNPINGTRHLMTLELGERPRFDGKVRTAPGLIVTEPMIEEISDYIRSRAASGVFGTIDITDTTITAQLAGRIDDLLASPGPSR